MADPAVICVAITGSLPQKSNNPAVPITVAEQVESTQEAFEAGAAIVHAHVRNADGSPTSDPEKFALLMEGVRKHCPGMIVQLSTGGRSGAEKERGGMLPLKPEMASLAVGSNNFPTRVYENSPQLVDWLASEMLKYDVKPEIEAFDLSHIFQAAAMVKDGRLKAPLHVQFVMGVKNAMPVDRASLEFMIQAADAGGDLVRRRDRAPSGDAERVVRGAWRALPHGTGGQHAPRQGHAGAVERRAGEAMRRDSGEARPPPGDGR